MLAVTSRRVDDRLQIGPGRARRSDIIAPIVPQTGSTGGECQCQRATYSDALHQEGRNLTRLALDKQIALPVYREQAIAAVLAAIKRNRSVLLVGDIGIGKTAVPAWCGRGVAQGKAGAVGDIDQHRADRHAVPG